MIVLLTVCSSAGPGSQKNAVKNCVRRPEVALSSGRIIIDPDEFEADGLETRSARHARRFLEYMNEHPNRPLYLAEICAALCVAERTLRNACETHLGMGPIRYLTLYRMHQVRQALLSADPSTTRVTDVLWSTAFASWAAFLARTALSFASRPQRRCGVNRTRSEGFRRHNGPLSAGVAACRIRRSAEPCGAADLGAGL